MFHRMEPSDDIAIGKARRGDRDAFRALVERHAMSVFRLAFRMTANRTDAEDITQETFLRAWKQIARFDGRASFATWVHRICANCSLDVIRVRRRRQSSAPVFGDERDADPFAHLPSAAPSPERIAHSSQISAILVPALDELSAMERAAFVMRHYEGRSIEEIAATLGVQEGAAKHSVFRAVQKLRRALEPVMTK
jgi:RNA polymerase sigma-70 factor (ECF subfamily)